MPFTPDNLVMVEVQPKTFLNRVHALLDMPISQALLDRAETLITEIERDAVARDERLTHEDAEALSIARRIAWRCRRWLAAR